MMLEAIGEPAMLEQLAEECAELGKAALKAARVQRGENPTPVTSEEAWASLKEEYTDVIQCGIELGIQIDEKQMDQKLKRFCKRMHELNHAEEASEEEETEEQDTEEQDTDDNEYEYEECPCNGCEAECEWAEQYDCYRFLDWLSTDDD